MTDTLTTQDIVTELLGTTETPAPATINPHRRQPTEPMLSYATSLARSELKCPEETIAKFPTMDFYEVGRMIDHLKKLRSQRLNAAVTDAKAAVLAIPAGRYAVVVADKVRLYRVRISANSKRPYLVAMVGNGERYMGTQGSAGAILARIAEHPRAAAMLYGEVTGHCPKCGAELTDPKSVAAKIGPVCAKTWGW